MWRGRRALVARRARGARSRAIATHPFPPTSLPQFSRELETRCRAFEVSLRARVAHAVTTAQQAAAAGAAAAEPPPPPPPPLAPPRSSATTFSPQAVSRTVADLHSLVSTMLAPPAAAAAAATEAVAAAPAPVVASPRRGAERLAGAMAAAAATAGDAAGGAGGAGVGDPLATVLASLSEDERALWASISSGDR